MTSKGSDRTFFLPTEAAYSSLSLRERGGDSQSDTALRGNQVVKHRNPTTTRRNRSGFLCSTGSVDHQPRLNGCGVPKDMAALLATLQKQLANEQPPWLYRVEASFEKPLLSVPIDSSDSAAVLLAWAGPITMNP
jgi:hypothetical protein